MRKSKLKRIGIYVSLVFMVSCDAVFEDDLSSVEVNMTSPSSGAELASSTVSFSWSQVDETIEYSVQIVDSAFSEEDVSLVLDTLVESNSFTRELYLGSFEWRVKALNSSSESAYQVSSFSITSIGGLSNAPVSINTPEDMSFQNDSLIYFEWEELPGAVDYTIKIYDGTNGVQGDLTESETTTADFAEIYLPEGEFVWTIVGSNEDGGVSALSGGAFRVDRSAPSEPEALSPNSGLFNNSEMIDFSWNSGADIESTIIDSLFVYSLSPTILEVADEVSDSFSLDSSELGVGDYEWQIVTYDQAGNWTSSVFSTFEVSE